MKKVCLGTAFQNAGQTPKFETEEFPHFTFEFNNEDEVCAPGIEAEILATVDTDNKTAEFWGGS